MYDLHSIHAQLQDKKSPLFRTEQKMIHCLYCKMDNLQGNEDPLFLMWQNELEFTYGNLGDFFLRIQKSILKSYVSCMGLKIQKK